MKLKRSRLPLSVESRLHSQHLKHRKLLRHNKTKTKLKDKRTFDWKLLLSASAHACTRWPFFYVNQSADRNERRCNCANVAQRTISWRTNDRLLLKINDWVSGDVISYGRTRCAVSLYFTQLWLNNLNSHQNRHLFSSFVFSFRVIENWRFTCSPVRMNYDEKIVEGKRDK